MSSIAFQSLNRTVYISGRERASLGIFCQNWLYMQLAPSTLAANEFVGALLGRSYEGFGSNLHAMRDLQLQCAAGDYFTLGDEKYEIFAMALNSVLTDGNRAAQLAAKIHGQCEIHCYVEGEDRAWMAEIVEEGLATRIFRPNQGWAIGKPNTPGWEALAEFLCEDSETPVVASYSVCDSFPGPHLAPVGWAHDPEDPWEAWSELSPDEQWAMAMQSLREERGLRLSPDRLATPFYDGLNGREFQRRVFDFLAAQEASAKGQLQV